VLNQAAEAPKNEASFHNFDEFERLVEVARSETLALLVVLIGGEAGLRCGEMMALEWTDIDFAKRQLTVARCEWKGHVTMPNSVATTKFTIRISRDSKPDGEQKLQSFQPLNRLRSARPSSRASSVSIGVLASAQQRDPGAVLNTPIEPDAARP
jgi:integrase